MVLFFAESKIFLSFAPLRKFYTTIWCVLKNISRYAVNENIFNSTTAFPSGRAQKNSEKNQQVVFSLDALMLISQTIT